MRRIAETIRAHVSAYGFVAELGDAATHGMPAVPDYDAVIVGTTISRLRDREIVRWVDGCRDELGEIPAALFIAGPDHRLGRALEHVFRVLRWRPVMIEAFPLPGMWRRWLVGEPASFDAQAAKLSERVAEAVAQRQRVSGRAA
jgi:menaquinone-dependent protoporphyrinogen IX oxidase